jgi:hypothetical protein
VKYLIFPLKWPEVGTDRQKWHSHLESIRKDIERTFGSIKQRFGCLVNPITLQEDHRLEKMFNGCCVLHNIILDYNGADNWRKRVVGGFMLPAEVIGDVPVIEKDFSTLATLIGMMTSGLLFKTCPIRHMILEQKHAISSMMMQEKSKSK